MRFARWVFLLAGLYGILVLVPPLFLEGRTGQDDPPVNHPEYYYGFFGVALAWQFLFLVIARDPASLRPAMPPAMLEKLGFAVAVPVLYAMHRVQAVVLVFSSLDAVWLVLFVIAYLKTPRSV